jgi:hypothetical protein
MKKAATDVGSIGAIPASPPIATELMRAAGAGQMQLLLKVQVA